MIILHSQHEEVSRKFVDLYGEGNEVISYPECVERFPWIRAFPSVIIEVPEHSIPDDWFGVTSKGYNVETHEELIDTPKDWKEVDKVVKFVKEWVAVSPAIRGKG